MVKSKLFFIVWTMVLMGCGKNVALLVGEDKGKSRSRPPMTSLFFGESAILFERPFKELPKEDKAYQKIMITESTKQERRNHITFKKRRSLVVDALHLILKKGEPFYDRFHRAKDIKKLIINGEIVEIHDRLDLPGSDLIINAKTLVIKKRGGFDITPLHKKGRPTELGKDGPAGENAGNITLNIASIRIPPLTAPRSIFKAKGGRGQDAGLGRKGKQGMSVPALNNQGVIYREYKECGSYTLLELKRLNREKLISCHVGKKEGQKKWPSDGKDATPGGNPGRGGKGGGFLSSVPIEKGFFDLSGGESGKQAPHYQGGEAGNPNPAYHVLMGGQTIKHMGKKGKDAISPGIRVPGPSGRFTLMADAQANWVRPGYLKMLFRYARDHYLQGNFEQTKSIYRQGGQFWDDLNDKQLSSVDRQRLKLLALEGNIHVQKIASRLDYFGHPMGWISEQRSLDYQEFVRNMEEGIDLIYNVLSRKKANRHRLDDLLFQRRQHHQKISKNHLQNFNAIQKKHAEIEGRKRKLFHRLKKQGGDEQTIHNIEKLFQLTSHHFWKENKISFKGITGKVDLLEEKNPDLRTSAWRGILFDNVRLGRVVDCFSTREKELSFFLEKNIMLANMNARSKDIKDEIVSIGEDIFLKYQHLVKRAYEYSLLIPYPHARMSYSKEIQENIRYLAETKQGEPLSGREKGRLIKAYSQKLAQDVQEIFEKSQEGMILDTLSFYLNSEELKHLNEGKILYMDLQKKASFKEDMEDVRIRNIRGMGEALSISSLGQTIIRKNGINYFFEIPERNYEKRQKKTFFQELSGNQDFQIDLGGPSRPAFKITKREDVAVLEDVLLEVDYSYREKF